MINKPVISAMKDINNITNSVILQYPTTYAASEARDVFVQFDISEYDKDEFNDVGIYNLGAFLNTFSLFEEERDVKFDGTSFTISNSTDTAVIISDDIDILEKFSVKPGIFGSMDTHPSVATYELSKENMKKLIKAGGIYEDLNEVQITSQDSYISMELTKGNRFNSFSNTFKTDFNGDTSKEFKVSIPLVNFNMLPIMNYTVEIKYNESRDAYRILLTSKEKTGFKILMAVKV